MAKKTSYRFGGKPPAANTKNAGKKSGSAATSKMGKTGSPRSKGGTAKRGLGAGVRGK